MPFFFRDTEACTSAELEKILNDCITNNFLNTIKSERKYLLCAE